MNLNIEFGKPQMKSSFDWQLIQEVNVLNEKNETIAKAELELITLNKHRDAAKSYAMIESEDEATDWELPLNLYFKGQNLSAKLCESLNIKPDIKKAKTHIMIEAISVSPSYRKQGISKFLLKEIAKHHHKIQSITVLSMPMNLFVDAAECEEEENKVYYQQLDLNNDKTSRIDVADFFKQSGFIDFKVDEALLAEPLSFDIFITTPEKIAAL